MKQDCRHSTSDVRGVQLWCIPQIGTSTWFPPPYFCSVPQQEQATGRSLFEVGGLFSVVSDQTANFQEQLQDNLRMYN
jgi:hypothetical protein